MNLTGADVVIFYDNDWNPTMDAQAQDRCHRIGQTREVHIYRMVTQKTVEENILKKAQQKRQLASLAARDALRTFLCAHAEELVTSTRDVLRSAFVCMHDAVSRSAGHRHLTAT